MENNLFESRQTDLDLNGPYLSFPTQPESVTGIGTNIGGTTGATVTMIGISTVSFIGFATSTDIPNYPDFLDIQVKSFQDFFQLETKSNERSDEGLYKTFLENFPISDARNQFVLEFLDYFVDPPRYSTQE